ncbi:MAG: stage 0 sporulation family protein [Lachnospiraceae bacterium]|nr:stage 0 sporulation family protein [Lachnospiraceae bacterium]
MKVIGVRLRKAGKVYYFNGKDYVFKYNDPVIVETARGVELGRVVVPERDIDPSTLATPLKTILRPATEDDVKHDAENKERCKEAYRICKEKILLRNLPMKLISAEYTFDNNKILFYFFAEGRVDFRELVKDLAPIFRTRVELRQVGIKDATKMMGGMGICGREFCCHAFLDDFSGATIKMAKDQNLTLSSGNLTGFCGRLMCCLKYESETYEYLNSKLPDMGDEVIASDGNVGTVVGINILMQKVKVKIVHDDDSDINEYHVDELKIKEKRRKERKNREEDAELRALEKLEKKEGTSALDD